MEINTVKDVIVPIIIGVLASACFLLLISLIRPRLTISPSIANTGGSRPGSFMIKVVNRSKRDAIDISARLACVRRVNVGGGGFVNEYTDFTINNCPFMIPGKKGRTDQELEHSAYRFSTDEDVLDAWKDNQYFVSFSIVAKDGYTNFATVTTKDYTIKDDIRPGDFVIGHSFDIRPV